MSGVFRVAAAFLAGAVVMYFLDPMVGRRRRALMRDQGVAAGHDVEHFVRAKSKRAAGRVHGAMARARKQLSSEPVDDELLLERVRAKLGRLVEHPRAVEVAVRDGRVMLTGRASAEEIDQLMKTIPAMRGVEHVDNRLWVVRGPEPEPAGREARH